MSVGSIVTGVVLSAAPAVLAFSWVGSAGKRLAAEDAGSSAAAEPEAAIASAADEGYCNGDLRNVPRSEMISTGYKRKDGSVAPDTHTYDCLKCTTRFEINQAR